MWDHGSLHNSSCDDDTSRKEEPKVNENRASPHSASPLRPHLASVPGSCTAVQSQAGPPADLCPRPWTWSGRLPGDLGSCFGQGKPVLRRLGICPTEQGAVVGLTWGQPCQEGSTGSADLLRGWEAPVKPPGRVGAFSKCHTSWSTRKGQEWRAGASACADNQKC